MANTFTQLLYHIVFSTKNRCPTIAPKHKEELYGYIWGIHKELDSHLYRIGGTADHVHILASIPKTAAVSELIGKVKANSSKWMRGEANFPDWDGWQDGYGAFTVSWADKEDITEYIRNQEEHHKVTTFHEEFRQMLEKSGVEYDEQYLI